MKDENMKNAVPIVINEEYLGGNSTREQAVRVVEILTERGYDVSYGVPTGYGENAQQIPDSEWNEVLNLACNTINADTAPAQAGGHTPGLWTIHEPEAKAGELVEHTVRLADDTGNLTLGFVCVDIPEGRSNARLIASAPALLAALRDCADSLEVRFQTDYPNEAERTILSTARAAIAQAERGAL
jgi:hypothetical protein